VYYRVHQINTKSIWEQLLWLGPDNWGGIRYVDEQLHSPSNEIAAVEDGDEDVSDEILREQSMVEELAAASAIDSVGGGADDCDEEFADDFAPKAASKSKKGAAPVRDAVPADEYDWLDDLEPSTSRKRSTGDHNDGNADDDDDDDDGDVSDSDANAPGDAYYDETLAEAEPISLVQSHWNMATHLPDGAAERFKIIIGEIRLLI
jgi:hypothetical protein